MNRNHKLFRVCVHVHALKRDDDDDGSSVKIQIKINSDSALTHPEAINPNTKMLAFKREFHANYFSAQRNINSAIFILPSRTKQHRKSSMMKADSKFLNQQSANLRTPGEASKCRLTAVNFCITSL